MNIKKFFVSRYLNILRRLGNNKYHFVLGIIFGAVFGLVVNVITVQLQEVIQVQRVEEALENEILMDGEIANEAIDENTQLIKNNSMPDYYRVTKTYVYDVWTRSDAINYTIQNDPAVQTKISVFYDYVIPYVNGLLNKNSILENNLTQCYTTAQLTTSQINDCKNWNNLILEGEITGAQDVSKSSFDILKVFHPTRDRLKNPLLVLLMGKQAVGALTTPQK